MKTNRIWHGVRMRITEASADPDSPPRPVRLPASWNDTAATALSALIPGDGLAALPEAAERWIRPIAARAAEWGLSMPIADRLHALLLHRRGAPDPAIWAGTGGITSPRFVLNLPAFHHAEAGFDVPGFIEAVETATLALALAAPNATKLGVGFADLAGLLAALGLPYASVEARILAACLAGLMRGRADLVSATLPRLSRPQARSWPAPPRRCVLPGLADAAAQAHALAGQPHHKTTTGLGEPGAVEALLGAETGGIAPSFAPVRDGCLTRTAMMWLTARGLSPEAALAATLAGDSPFPEAGAAARLAMHDAVAPFLHALPAIQPDYPAGTASQRRPLPSRHGGYTQRASINGHRLTLRTGEYADGQLGEITLSMGRDNATSRALLDALSAAISLGLQHGIGLDAFVDLFGQTRFSPAGAVEGDPGVTQASSVLDYAMRHLAANYLGRADLPAPALDESEPPRHTAPLLPLDLPRERGLRRLRLVGE